MLTNWSCSFVSTQLSCGRLERLNLAYVEACVLLDPFVRLICGDEPEDSDTAYLWSAGFLHFAYVEACALLNPFVMLICGDPDYEPEFWIQLICGWVRT